MKKLMCCNGRNERNERTEIQFHEVHNRYTIGTQYLPDLRLLARFTVTGGGAILTGVTGPVLTSVTFFI